MEIPSSERASYNFYRVLHSIWRSDGISRTELASSHTLDKTTISQIVSELISEELVSVVDVDTTISRPGRKSELLSVSDRWGAVAGIELRAYEAIVCATDMHGNPIAQHRHPVEVRRNNIKQTVVQVLESIQADDRLAGLPLIGAGIGLSGMVNRHHQTVIKSIPLGIDDPYDFASHVGSALGFPVIVDNDANCAAHGELVWNKSSEQITNGLFVLLEFREGATNVEYSSDVGMGLGFIINGSVYYGDEGSAGEFRSIFYHPGHNSQFSISDQEAIGAIHKPAVLPRLIEEIAQHVALFVNTLNLKRVIVGGDVGSIREMIVDSFESAINANWPYPELVRCGISISRQENNIVATGAAAMMLSHVFSEPLLASALREKNAVWDSVFRARAGAVGTGA